MPQLVKFYNFKMFNLCEYTCIKGRCLTLNCLTLFYFACHFIFRHTTLRLFFSVIVDTEPMVNVLLLIYDTDYNENYIVNWPSFNWVIIKQSCIWKQTLISFFLIFKSFKFFLCFFLNINYLIKVFSGICCWRFWCREWFLYF